MNPLLIVLMVLDDFGRELISSERTPNLERMIQRGTSFTCAYSMGLCVPSRATLNTGMYPFDTGWNGHFGHWFHPVSPTLVDSGFPLWPTFLPPGWRAIAAGKWQLGDASRHGPAVMVDTFGFHDYRLWDGGAGPEVDRYYGEPIHTPDGSITTAEFSEHVFLRFVHDEIRRTATTGEPAVIYYPLLLPHTPLVVTPDGGAGDLASMVAYADRIVGYVNDTVDFFGLTGHALVMVTSDNGTDAPGRKGTLTEAGVNVPLIVRGGGVPAGRMDDTVIDFTDFATTIPILAGADPAALSAHLRGHDFSPAIFGRGGSTRSTAISCGLGILKDRGDGLLKTGKWPRGPRIAARRVHRLSEEGDVVDRATGQPANAPGAEANMRAALDALPEVDRALPANPAAVPFEPLV